MNRDAGLCRAVESRLVSATGCGNEEGKPNCCHFLPPFKQKTKNKEQIQFRQLKNCLPPAHPQRSLEQGQFGVQIVFSF